MTKLIDLGRDKVALVDDEDYDRLSAWKWFAHEVGGVFYAKSVVVYPDKSKQYLVII